APPPRHAHSLPARRSSDLPSGTVDLEPGVPRPDSPPERLGQIARVALARGALEDQGKELRSARALQEVAHRDGAARVVSPLGDRSEEHTSELSHRTSSYAV